MKLFWLIALLLVSNCAVSNNLEKDSLIQPVQSKAQFTVGGYVKTDLIYTQYNNGTPSSGAAIRDFLIPSQIPVGASDIHRDLNMHVKESRLNFTFLKEVKGKQLKVFTEADFLLSVQGNQLVSNSYALRMRHFFVQYNGFLVGQTWSNFMIVELPQSVDFTGVPAGLVFARQPQIRYSKNNWSVAIENPEKVVSFDSNHFNSVTEVFVPDITVQKKMPFKNGYWSVGAIGRYLVGHVKETPAELGFGVTSGGVYFFGNEKTDVRSVFTYGQGLGRYLSLLYVPSSIELNNQLVPIETLNGYIAVRHQFNSRWSASVDYSILSAINLTPQMGDMNQQTSSYSINIFHHIAEDFVVGVEYNYAASQNNLGEFGDLHRYQASLKYNFSISK